MMKINLEKQDKLIERLGKITSSIKSIYEKMNHSTKNTEKYKKLEEYLQLTIEIEDSNYNKIQQLKEQIREKSTEKKQSN